MDEGWQGITPNTIFIIKDKTMKNNKGFSLLEVIVTSGVMLLILGGLYFSILTTQTIHMSEGRKLDMTQSGRALEQILFDNLRSAGALFNFMHTPGYLNEPAPFMGVYPLNNQSFPDGVIVSAGDSSGLTKLTADFTPGATTINVTTVNDPFDGSQTAWERNDVGMVLHKNGYYVFRVDPNTTVTTGDTQLSLRAAAVYYSGLLDTTNYDDLSEESSHLGTKGNTFTYPIDSPVIKLRYFNIFLVREIANTNGKNIRILTLTTDCGDSEGNCYGNVLANPSATRAVPIVPNLEDIQFEYISKDSPEQYYASARPSGSSEVCSATNAANYKTFLDQFTNKNIAGVMVHILLKSEEETNKRANSGTIFDKPLMGDAPALELPKGRFFYDYINYEIFIRNFSAVY
jgi:type II secretory pathway pseudopilin PulG